jgi:hypothetical protein
MVSKAWTNVAAGDMNIELASRLVPRLAGTQIQKANHESSICSRPGEHGATEHSLEKSCADHHGCDVNGGNEHVGEEDQKI